MGQAGAVSPVKPWRILDSNFPVERFVFFEFQLLYYPMNAYYMGNWKSFSHRRCSSWRGRRSRWRCRRRRSRSTSAEVSCGRNGLKFSVVKCCLLNMYTVYHLLGGRGFMCFWFGTMHTGWVKNKTHETSTFKQMINGVATYCPDRMAGHSKSKTIKDFNRPDASPCSFIRWPFQPWSYTVYHLLEGRRFLCFVFDPASVHGPKSKHTKPLPPSRW